MRYLGKIDEYIIGILQGLYLKVLDYTGVYVASIMSATCVLGMGVDVLYSDWLAVGVLGFNGLISCPWRWAWQHSNKEDLYNIVSLSCRDQRIRKIFCFTALTVFIPMSFFFVRNPPASLALQLVLLLVTYFSCILIRKREPKEFFKRAPALSLQGN